MPNRKRNWFGEKIKSDGYTFDSKKEEAFYRNFVKNSGYQFDVHKSFMLHPIIDFLDGRLRLRSSNYTPDFVLYDKDGELKHVIDVKTGFNMQYNIDPAAALRFKLFALQYKHPVEVVVPNLKSFRVKIVGATKKFNPTTMSSLDYDLEDLISNKEKSMER